MNRRRYNIVIVILLFSLGKTEAQDIYKWEWGGAIGGSFYMGDANATTPYKHTGLAGGVIARYLINPHTALKGNLFAGRIAGDTGDFKNAYPHGEYATFKRTVFDVGVQFEYNFFGYGAEQTYRNESPFTPYLTGGIGATVVPRPAKTDFTMNIPIGVGVKYKVAPRINMGCEFTMRFSLSDRLDVARTDGLQLDNPWLIKGKGWKNKDSYSFTLFFLTYDLFPVCKECNN
ncbi:MAG: DUF6089 family protein [Prevotellaceae bacterium]|jgi:hypothetical protein|nr:DUF6089 family protein [Prevotellaceae bacterium]